MTRHEREFFAELLLSGEQHKRAQRVADYLASVSQRAGVPPMSDSRAALHAVLYYAIDVGLAALLGALGEGVRQ